MVQTLIFLTGWVILLKLLTLWLSIRSQCKCLYHKLKQFLVDCEILPNLANLAMSFFAPVASWDCSSVQLFLPVNVRIHGSNCSAYNSCRVWLVLASLVASYLSYWQQLWNRHSAETKHTPHLSKSTHRQRVHKLHAQVHAHLVICYTGSSQALSHTTLCASDSSEFVWIVVWHCLGFLLF